MREIRTLRARRRGLETDSWQAGLRRCSRKGSYCHRKPKGTAPALDPTASTRLLRISSTVAMRAARLQGLPDPDLSRYAEKLGLSSGIGLAS